MQNFNIFIKLNDYTCKIKWHYDLRFWKFPWKLSEQDKVQTQAITSWLQTPWTLHIDDASFIKSRYYCSLTLVDRNIILWTF